MNMKWTTLLIIRKKFLIFALITLFILPFIVDVKELFALTSWPFKAAIVGACLYLPVNILVGTLCPPLILAHPDKHAYVRQCLDLKVNIYTAFVCIEELSESQLRTRLGKYDFLYPPANGIAYSPTDTVREYATINHSHVNVRDPWMRRALSLFFFLSLLLINIPSIVRIVHALGFVHALG